MNSAVLSSSVGRVKGRGKVYLCKDRGVLVTRYHLNCVVGKLEHLGLFGRDNMAGFDGLLHRVGVMRDKGGKIYGVTIRVGRYAKGMADMVDDLLFNHHTATGSGKRASQAPASILVLGRHGAGKTTLVRDMCRKLSSHETVVIVDTRSDIGGAGVVPHRRAIGEESRRVMVPQGMQQHEVILQAYRNHSPQTIVVDEISSQLDIEACMAVKARGIRVVAGAVGDLPYVLDSPEIGAALGGLEDIQRSANVDDDSDDQMERRAGSPVFEAVVELEGRAGGAAPQGAVVTNVEAVVDELLDKGCVTRPEMRAPVGEDDVMLDEDAGEDAAGGIGGHGSCTPFLRKVSRDQADKWVW
ncbi:conserved unknown protein [Ectocarpus siliculosus]|uniref:AAA+ ATPase domain-containing protein n=1 Tax=Ectocarpus siliculosus TaxID=2880 RepID=D7G6R4_ECTSI|nr:conserved unknown protein [Ectocarpus siliculosus]|eukprot:CBJ27608.1 conserved unknown protein [Ectocarpus siliculosus]